jgi:MFS family permease
VRVRGLAPLRNRDFALYWAGLGISQIGDSIETTATAWLLYDITRSPVLLGLGGGIRALSVIVFGLVGGAVADRVPRRQLLLITQTGFALSSLVLGVLVLTGQVTFWHVYAFTAVNGTLGAFDAPGRRSLFPTLVPRGELQNAITLNGTLFRTARLAGAPIAGIVIATSGAGVAYFMNVASYAAILAALVVMRPPAPAARPRASLMREVIAGPRYALAHPLLRSVIALEAAHSLFGVNAAFLTILASDVFHTGPTGLGLLLGAQAVGSVTSSVVLVTLGDVERKGDAMLVSGVAYATALALLGLVTQPEVGLVLVTCLGLTDGFWSTLRNTVFQLKTDDAYRGRTLSVLLVASRGGTQASHLESGLAVSVGGPAFAALLGAAAIGASLLAVNVSSREVRAFRGLPDPVLAAVSAGTEDDAVV